MARKTLAEIDAAVNIAARDTLGHRISYRAGASASWKGLLVQGNYEEEDVTSGVSGVIEQRSELMILRSDLPIRPAADHRIRASKFGSGLFQPINPRLDQDGAHWIINLKKVVN